MPAANFNGTDSFTFTANDGGLTSEPATFTLNVNPVNDAPVAVDDGVTAIQNQPLSISAATLLGNDTDIDASPVLNIASVANATNGRVVLLPDGSVSFTPTAGFTGTASFTYRTSDGFTLSEAATVLVTVTADPGILGTPGDDTIPGTTGDDTISGLAGADQIDGDAGSDLIYGGTGNDTIYGGAGAGSDTFDGGDDDDTIFNYNATGGTAQGGSGDDRITVVAADSIVDGGTGRDVLGYGGTTDISGMTISGIEVVETGGSILTATVAQLAGLTTITVLDDPQYDTSVVDIQLVGTGAIDMSGLVGQRTVIVNASALGNAITGTDGDDQLWGNAGNDSLSGGAGADFINGGTGGNDTLYGGSGSDDITAGSSGTGVHIIDGGDDNDIIFNYSAVGGNVQAGEGDDQIFVAAANSIVDGGTGRDVLQNLGGTDYSGMTISGIEVIKTGGSTITATVAQLAGLTTLTVEDAPEYDTAAVSVQLSGTGTIDMSGLLGQRALTAYASALGNTITAGDQADQLYGGAGDDSLSGGAGADDLYDGAGGNDTLPGGSGDDLIQAGLSGTGVHVIDGGDDNDTIFNYSALGGNVQGGSGDDRITVVAADSTVDGGTGRDVLGYGTNDISGMTISGIEVVETGGATITATVAQLAGLTTLTVADDPAYDAAGVSVQLADAGAIDMSRILGQRTVTATASALGNAIAGGDSNDTLYGGAGNDSLSGGAGADYLYDGAGGNDTLLGGSGDDLIQAGLSGMGVHVIDGGGDNDTIYNYSAFGGNVQGGSGDDKIYVAAYDSTVDGGTGRDVLGYGTNDISGMTISGIEVVETGGATITATAAQLSALTTLTLADDPIHDTSTVSVQLAGGGAIDMSGLLGQRALVAYSSANGNEITGGDQADQLNGGIGNDSLTGGRRGRPALRRRGRQRHAPRRFG